MLVQPTVDRLRQMRLTGLAECLLAQMASPAYQALSFEERLGLLVEQEWTYRQYRRLGRLLREAKLRLPACPEEINYRHPRGLNRSVVARLVQGHWLRAHQNVILSPALPG
jgi:DNA replication protein DnaC